MLLIIRVLQHKIIKVNTIQELNITKIAVITNKMTVITTITETTKITSKLIKNKLSFNI
jgi:hypothetical protein